jgi:DEAD/DEAH box helicase domain-containing protein
MKNIVGLELADIEVVTEDGAPSAQKHLLVWNPPFKDPMAPSLGRHSSLS